MLFHGAYILNEEPLVMGVLDYVVLSKIAEKHRNGPVYCLLHLTWNHAKVHKIIRKKIFLESLRRKGLTPLLITNSLEEDAYRRFFKVPGFHCNEYIYTDEKDYGVLNIEKKHDAVYAAQLMPFKRIELAREIDKIFVLTYTPGSKVGENNLPDLCPSMKHADYNRTWVDHVGKNRLFNQSKVGLCLSKEEGPMLASLEYMLSGLPVVSTRSKGGRDEYYNKDYCLIVDDNPAAVRKGVEELIARQIDPHYIREKTIEKLNRDRDRYVNLLSEYVRKDSHIILDPVQLRHKFFDKPKNNFVPIDKLWENQ